MNLFVKYFHLLHAAYSTKPIYRRVGTFPKKTGSNKKLKNSSLCSVYLGPPGLESADHLSVSQSLVIVFQTGVDLGAVAEENVVQRCWRQSGRKETVSHSRVL